MHIFRVRSSLAFHRQMVEKYNQFTHNECTDASLFDVKNTFVRLMKAE